MKEWAVPKAKEPWQMTRREFMESWIRPQGRKRGDSEAQIIKDIDAAVEPPLFGESRHKQLIEKALSEGKPVSLEVLKDYPDLAKAVPKAISNKILNKSNIIETKGIKVGKTEYQTCMVGKLRAIPKGVSKEERKLAFCVGAKLCSGKASTEKQAIEICSIKKRS